MRKPKYLRAIGSLALLVFTMTAAVPPVTGQNRGSSYELVPAPDLWYNDVDGIRIGVRLRGRKPGTFRDGPHRLKTGLWLGTWLPNHPVSYYLSFTEPIPSISDFGSEGNVKLRSSYRTGFHRHGVTFNKRWQQGFDERIYKEASVGVFAQKRINREYLFFPGLWQQRWLYLAEGKGLMHGKNGLGRYNIRTSVAVNVAGPYPTFAVGTLEYQQRAPIGNGFAVNGRIFAGAASENTAPEYLFSAGLQSPVYWMNNGLTRAKGTIPVPWFESGVFQVAGGPNLRGYTDRDIALIDRGLFPLFRSFGSVNIELDYPNPVASLFKKIPVVGELVTFRSYLFLDTGTSLGLREGESGDLLSDAGPGFALHLNIPDYLGKPRGLFLRYDIPAWVSDPGDNESFAYRSVIGIGAVIEI